MPFIFDTLLESSYDFADTDYIDELVAENTIYDDSIEDISYIEEAASDFVGDMYKLESAIYITDYTLERAVATESAMDIDAVLEDSSKSIFAKIKEKISELWQKFVNWIKNVVTSFKSFGIASESFVKKNGKAILENFDKNGKKYIYSGYQYEPVLNGTISSGHTQFSSKLVQGARNSGEMNMDELFASIGTLIQANRPTSTANEVLAVYTENCRGSKVTDVHPTSRDVNAWLNVCKDSKKTLKDINKTNADTKKTMNGMVAEVKKLEKEADRGTEAARKAHMVVQKVSAIAALATRIGSANVNISIEAYKTFTRRLREIQRLKDSGDNKDVGSTGLALRNGNGLPGDKSLTEAAFDLL